MTKPQINAALVAAGVCRSRALQHLQDAIKVLKPAAASARRLADSLPMESEKQMARAEEAWANAERVETALGDVEVLVEEVRSVKL